ncbi:MAG: FAD-dependent thymidylate synthase [Planctomycetota bacterium]|nr:FAD-dependent thymidylate synthase [Planctomycetota bacterium]
MHFVKPKVELLRHTPDPERVVASAAHLCYNSSGLAEIQKSMTDKQVERLIGHCVSMGHHSVLEHATFTYGVEGISRTMTHQLVRHRIASYSQQSQRYVEYDDVSFIVPPKIAGDERLLDKYKEVLREQEKAYRALVDSGIAPEDARYVLPNATETKIAITMNARELLHFFTVRCCNRAQWEIRAVATEMLRLARKAAPTVFNGAGPSCLRGPCPEGKMTCGKAEEVREFFRNM